MFTAHEVHDDREIVEASFAILQEVFSEYHPRNFSVRLWNGAFWDPEPGEHERFRLVLTHPGSLRAMFMHPTQLSLGEAYVYNDFDIEGDLEAAFAMAAYLLNLGFKWTEKVHLAALVRKLPANLRDRTQGKDRKPIRLKGALHSKERDRQAVTYHYDVSNEFFSLWLDPNMIYSCAYFLHPTDSLESAQEQKLDYLCRKLDLHSGDRLLDLGCGWGGLICYAAKAYGVRAHGITLSSAQAEHAHTRITQEGLTDRVSVEVKDYRELDESSLYDKIVSVGMVEHVGLTMLGEYFERAFRLLKPGGRFLNHGISNGFNSVRLNGASFSDEYIFPDSEVLPLSTTIHAAETHGFEVRDVESLREHYMLTLRHWLFRLEAAHTEAVRLTDESTYRIWRLNHAGAAAGFASGRNTIFQTLCVKPANGRSAMPLTRERWYR